MRKPPPDRASVDRRSSHFTVLARYIRVFVDGVEQPATVVEYSISGGWVRRYVPDGRGGYVKNVSSTGNKVELTRGVITTGWKT